MSKRLSVIATEEQALRGAIKGRRDAIVNARASLARLEAEQANDLDALQKLQEAAVEAFAATKALAEEQPVVGASEPIPYAGSLLGHSHGPNGRASF